MLDEPTSGLDSLTSYIIVDNLRKLAHNEGRTVLMTIHQPSIGIYDMFDRLLLMAEGQMVYQGSSKVAVDYFDRHFELKCPEFTNPAEFFIKMLHHEDPENVKRYPKYFEAYDKEVMVQVEREIRGVPKSPYTKR